MHATNTTQEPQTWIRWKLDVEAHGDLSPFGEREMARTTQKQNIESESTHTGSFCFGVVWQPTEAEYNLFKMYTRFVYLCVIVALHLCVFVTR